MGDRVPRLRLSHVRRQRGRGTHDYAADGPSTTSLGQAAEREAVRHLRSRGYRVVDRNVRTSRGEIDIVAWDEGTLCFIEVKSRVHTGYGGAAAAVDRSKRVRLRGAAEAYLAWKDDLWGNPPECRFDVVAMQRRSRDEWDIEVFEDAF